MICQMCKKHTATTKLKTTVNGLTRELNLCPDCLAVYGYSNFGSLGFNDLFFDAYTKKKEVSLKKCSKCNKTFQEIVKSGKVGCENCYSEFKSDFKPLLSKIHGATKHKTSFENNVDDEIIQLKNELNRLVECEEYEKAAKLRDIIREKQGKQ